MITKLCQTSLIALLAACSAQAGVYIDARVSHLAISGTPEIGDIGRTIDEDFPTIAYSLAVGTKLSSRLNAEVRFTDLGDIDVLKVSPYWTIMPPIPEVILPVERYYRYQQSTRLYSLALPINVWESKQLSLVLTPLLNVEQSRVTLDDLFINAQTAGLTVPYPQPRFLDTDRTKVRLGTEATLAYHPTGSMQLSVTYSYLSLQAYDAHLLGAGLGWNF